MNRKLVLASLIVVALLGLGQAWAQGKEEGEDPGEPEPAFPTEFPLLDNCPEVEECGEEQSCDCGCTCFQESEDVCADFPIFNNACKMGSLVVTCRNGLTLTLTTCPCSCTCGNDSCGYSRELSCQ